MSSTLLIGGSSDLGKALKKRINGNITELNTKDLDLSDIEKVKNFKIKNTYSKIVFLSAINNPKALINTNDEEILRSLNVNFISFIFLIKKILKKNFIKKKKCNIVLMTSLYSKLGCEGRFSYSVSKHALLGIMRNICVEYGNRGVRINAVSPGYVDTKMTRKNLNKKLINKIKKYSPAQKLVKKNEVANLIKFLLSDQSASITGQEIIIDSGITINAGYGKG